MQIEIEYCQVWNYLPTATSLAAEIKDKYGVDPNLVASEGGVFEVTVNNNLVYSKKQLGRFPEPGEVQSSIDALSLSKVGAASWQKIRCEAETVGGQWHGKFLTCTPP